MISRVLLLILALSTWAAAQAPESEWAFVTGDEVRLRAGPGTDQPVLGLLSRGDVFTILEKQGDWACVIPRQVFVSAEQVTPELRVRTDGADLVLGPGQARLARVAAGVQLKGEYGRPYAMVESPSSPRYWVASQYLSLGGLAPRESDFVSADRLSLSAADYQSIAALEGLRLVVLPTDAPGTPELVHAESGRFGPSYQVKYTLGSEWYSINTGTSGHGGPSLRQPRHIVQTGLLGKVVVGLMNYGQSDELWMQAPGVLGASTIDGQACPLSVFFAGSPNLREDTVERVLKSLKVVRLEPLDL